MRLEAERVEREKQIAEERRLAEIQRKIQEAKSKKARGRWGKAKMGADLARHSKVAGYSHCLLPLSHSFSQSVCAGKTCLTVCGSHSLALTVCLSLTVTYSAADSFSSQEIQVENRIKRDNKRFEELQRRRMVCMSVDFIKTRHEKFHDPLPEAAPFELHSNAVSREHQYMAMRVQSTPDQPARPASYKRAASQSKPPRSPPTQSPTGEVPKLKLGTLHTNERGSDQAATARAASADDYYKDSSQIVSYVEGLDMAAYDASKSTRSHTPREYGSRTSRFGPTRSQSPQQESATEGSSTYRIEGEGTIYNRFLQRRAGNQETLTNQQNMAASPNRLRHGATARAITGGHIITQETTPNSEAENQDDTDEVSKTQLEAILGIDNNDSAYAIGLVEPSERERARMDRLEKLRTHTFSTVDDESKEVR